MIARLEKNKKSLSQQKQLMQLSHSPITTMQLSFNPNNQQKTLSKTQPISIKNIAKNHKKSSSTTKYPQNNNQKPSKQQAKKSISLDNQDVIKIIEESQSLIKNNQLLQGINLLKAMKDTSVKIQSQDLMLVILLNLSVTYYQTGFLEEAFEDFQILADKLNQLAQNAQSAGKFLKKLKYSTLQAKVQLQICILFSQLGKHDQALKHARKSCKINFQLIYDVMNYLCKNYLKNQKTNERNQSQKNEYDNLFNNILLLEHLHKLIGDLNQIFHIPDKIKISKQMLSEIKKNVPHYRNLKVDMDLLFHENQDQEKSSKIDWIFNSKILDQIQLKTVNPNFFDEESQIHNAQIVQKITYLAISFYCYSTQIRFIEKTQDDVDEDQVMDSEHWLSRSLEIAYSFMPPNAPILNQILTVHDRFHGIDKQTIPQDKQIRGFFKVLKPLSKPKSIYSSKSHMNSPIMIRIQAPKVTIDIEEPEFQKHPKSTGKIAEYGEQNNKIFDLQSFTKNNKIKGLNAGIKILQFNETKTISQSQRARPSQLHNSKLTSRSTISDLSSLESDKDKKIRISKIYNVNRKNDSKFIDFKQDRKNFTQLDGKAILSQDLLHRPHSYDRNINKWEQIEMVNKTYTMQNQKRRKSLPSKNKQKLEKIVYNGSMKFDGLKLTGKKYNQTFEIDSSFLEKLNQAHNNQETIIQNAKKMGGNIFINNNINLYISKGQGQPKTSREANNELKDDISKRQKFISKRRLSHLNVYPSGDQFNL